MPLRFPGGTEARGSGDELVRNDSCALCRGLLGAPGAGAGWMKRLGLVAAGTACDQERRMVESFARTHGIPVRAFGVPRTLGENARGRYRAQLARLASTLESLAGARLDPTRLREEAARHRESRRRLRALGGRLPFGEFLGLVEDCLFLGARRALALLDETVDPEGRKPSVRLLLAGSCLDRSEAAELDAVLEPAGAGIVDDVTAFPAGWLDLEVPADGDALEALADAHFAQPDPGRRPNDAWLAHLGRRAKSARADAVLFRFVRFCDTNAAEQLRVKEALAPLPVFFLEEDASSGADARRRTRLEAALEALSCRRA